MNTAIRTVMWLTLSGWMGGLGLFAFVVAPTAFTVLPSVDVAGQLVSPILSVLNCYGIGAGILLTMVGWHADLRRARVVLPAVLALGCVISEFVITPAVAQVLPSDLGPGSSPDAGLRFHAYHQASRILFFLTFLGTVALVILHAGAGSSAANAETHESTGTRVGAP